MRIAVVGPGRVGQALGNGWVKSGHRVTFGTRDPQSDKIKTLLAQVGGKATAATIEEAVAGAEIVVLATPWAAAERVAKSIADWGGKVLVDCTNPIAPGLQLAVGQTTSGGEQIAGWAHNARVVKAFNTTGWENMADPVYGGQSTTMFIAGDDDEAKAAVTQLAQDLGFDVADTGPLSAARFLEPLAIVWIRLARTLGRDIALKLVKR